MAVGFVAILLVAKVADVTDGAVLAALLIVPALLYLLLSDRVSELRGPAGLEVKLAKAARQAIPGPGEKAEAGAISFEQVQAIEKGRTESFVKRIQDVTTEEPVVLTLRLSSGPLDGEAAADYATGLTQFPRFRFVAILDSQGKLVSYMQERSFRHVIEAKVSDAERLLSGIERGDVGTVRTFPGMVVSTLAPGASVAEALRAMERLRLDAMLVAEDGELRGLVERTRLVDALLLSLLEHASG